MGRLLSLLALAAAGALVWLGLCLLSLLATLAALGALAWLGLCLFGAGVAALLPRRAPALPDDLSDLSDLYPAALLSHGHTMTRRGANDRVNEAEKSRHAG